MKIVCIITAIIGLIMGILSGIAMGDIVSVLLYAWMGIGIGGSFVILLWKFGVNFGSAFGIGARSGDRLSDNIAISLGVAFISFILKFLLYSIAGPIIPIYRLKCDAYDWSDI